MPGGYVARDVPEPEPGDWDFGAEYISVAARMEPDGSPAQIAVGRLPQWLQEETPEATLTNLLPAFGGLELDATADRDLEVGGLDGHEVAWSFKASSAGACVWDFVVLLGGGDAYLLHDQECYRDRAALPAGGFLPDLAWVVATLTPPAPAPTASSSLVAADYLQLGRDFQAQDHLREAIDAYSGAIELDPTYVDAFFLRGRAFARADRLDLAIADYTRAIELDPTQVDAFSGRAMAHGEQDEPDLAIADYTRAIELDPDNFDLFLYRGIAQESLDEFDLAIADYTRAIELDPDNDRLYLRRAIDYAQLGKRKLANADFDQALLLTNDPYSIRKARCQALGIGCG